MAGVVRAVPPHLEDARPLRCLVAFWLLGRTPLASHHHPPGATGGVGGGGAVVAGSGGGGMSKPLSPAAQAVKDAALAMYAGPNVRRLAWPLDMPVVAAALRAAADHLDAESPWPGHIESTGVNWSRNELHKIANELGAQP